MALPCQPIAIGARLKSIPDIRTIGFKPHFQDYPQKIREEIQNAEKIYYPTAFYAHLFNLMGIQTFPGPRNYEFAMDKIRQTAAFQLLDIPHPETKVFYGKKQKKEILKHFSFPFVAKIPRGSSKGRGVFLIQTKKDLEPLLKRPEPAYIQQYLPSDRDIRVIVIGDKIRMAYWRIASGKEFKTNVSQGGTISFEKVPQKALDLALTTAQKMGWDDVGIDILDSNGRYYVLEGNMKYGTYGFKAAGIDYKRMLADLILSGEI